MPKKPSRRSSSIGRKHKKGVKDKAKAAARDAAASARAAMAAVKKQQNKIVDKVQKALMFAGTPLACASPAGPAVPPPWLRPPPPHPVPAMPLMCRAAGDINAGTLSGNAAAYARAT